DALVRKLYQHTFARQKPLKVISMTREPVGRAISSFFQNFTRDTGLSLEERNFDTEELKSLFLDQHDHYYALLWFDNNILKNFEIDVFGKAFDPEAGFQIYQKDNVSVLVLQSELTDPQKQEIIQQFLAFPDFLLQNENVGEAKSYSQTYQRFKQEVRLPATYLQYLCDSKYFRHFYSEEISQRLHDRWAEYATQS
ncbi:MAG: putative capsular polysaccharide synthesis family protein, partial [Bacteroidota bacterium]